LVTGGGEITADGVEDEKALTETEDWEELEKEGRVDVGGVVGVVRCPFLVGAGVICGGLIFVEWGTVLLGVETEEPERVDRGVLGYGEGGGE